MYKLNTKAGEYGDRLFLVVDNKHRNYMIGNTAACVTCAPHTPSVRGNVTVTTIKGLGECLAADGYTSYNAGSIEEANTFMTELAR